MLKDLLKVMKLATSNEVSLPKGVSFHPSTLHFCLENRVTKTHVNISATSPSVAETPHLVLVSMDEGSGHIPEEESTCQKTGFLMRPIF